MNSTQIRVSRAGSMKRVCFGGLLCGWLLAIIGISSVSHAAPGELAADCSWTGTWDTEWQDLPGTPQLGVVDVAVITQPRRVDGSAIMRLRQEDSGVTGSYGDDTTSVITGTIAGKTLVGLWAEPPSYQPPDHTGDLELTIAADCDSFEGRWNGGFAGTEWFWWTGTRLKENTYLPAIQR